MWLDGQRLRRWDIHSLVVRATSHDDRGTVAADRDRPSQRPHRSGGGARGRVATRRRDHDCARGYRVGVAVDVADGALEVADGVGVGVVEPCCWAIRSSTCAVATCDVREMYASKPIAPAAAILVDFWSSVPNCQADGAAAPAGHTRS